MHDDGRRTRMAVEQSLRGLQRARQWGRYDDIDRQRCHRSARIAYLFGTDSAERCVEVQRITAGQPPCGVERRFAVANADDRARSHRWWRRDTAERGA